MRILFFTHEKSYGGASRALVTLIKDLKDKHDIYVVVPFKDAKITLELQKLNVNIISCFYSWYQVPVNISKFKKLMYKGAYLFNYLSFYYLVNTIKKLDIDIIHSNTSVIDIGARVAKKLNIPHVWHFREFTGTHLKFIKSNTQTYNFINNNAGNIIYISKSIQTFYEQNINKLLGTLIYDGVSSEFVVDKKYKTKKDITFLLVATLEKNKGQVLAIKALSILKQKGYNNFKLLLAGGDPTGYSSYLNDLIKEYKLDQNVEYIGFIDDMKSLRKKVDVELMCAPSEAFGLVTIEGMLAGNPIIGSNSGATSELIKNDINGYLYELNNEDDLASKMELFLTTPNLVSKLGIKAKEYALKNFSSDNNSKSTIKLYNKILKEKK